MWVLLWNKKKWREKKEKSEEKNSAKRERKWRENVRKDGKMEKEGGGKTHETTNNAKLNDEEENFH